MDHSVIRFLGLPLLGLLVVGCQTAKLAAPDSFIDCPDCPEMVHIPPGSFKMGDLVGDGDLDERPVRDITINYAFAVGKYEVTQAQWFALMGTNPSYKKDGSKPVNSVSWEDARTYIQRLRQKTGRNYRFLTEAEWEYVSRAGTTTKYYWGNEVGQKNASCSKCGNSWDRFDSTPVGYFKPNAFGVYDMHGNVGEWVEDCKVDYVFARTDGSAVTKDIYGDGFCKRVIRGGAWTFSPESMTSSRRRSKLQSTGGYFSVGFRVAMDSTVPPTTSADYKNGLEAYRNEDYVAALKIWKPLAEQGQADAQNGLGAIYSRGGRGVPRDDKKAFRWYRLAAEQGLADAQDSLGNMYASGLFVAQDYVKAVEWLRLAADQGFPRAMLHLGHMHRHGLGVSQGLDESHRIYNANKWYLAAATQGEPVAQAILGAYYLKGGDGSQDETTTSEEALKWYRLSALQGNAHGQYGLGTMYHRGIGVPEDLEEAVKLYRLAAEQGLSFAQGLLGVLHIRGTGVPQDYEAGLKWLTLAAEQGDDISQNALGTLYEQGRGVPQDYKAALKWYTLSAEQNIDRAQCALGRMYENGLGVPQDHKLAVKWYTLSAEQGNAEAQNNLGMMYKQGLGVPQDMEAAMKWLSLAVEQGFDEAKKNLEAIIRENADLIDLS